MTKKWTEMTEQERDRLVMETFELKPEQVQWALLSKDGNMVDLFEKKRDAKMHLSGLRQFYAHCPSSKSKPVKIVTPEKHSTSIDAAWKVVQKLNKEGFCFVLDSSSSGNVGASVRKGDKQIYETDLMDNPAEAICLAALMAKGVEV